MDVTAPAGRWQRLLMAFGSLVLIVAALYWAKAVLLPLVLAILLTFILSPFVTRLQRLHLPRVAAVLLVVILAIALLTGIGLAVLSQLEGLAEKLPEQKPEIVAKIRQLQDTSRGSVWERIYQTILEIVAEVESAEKVPAQERPVPVTPVSSEGPSYLLALASPALETVLQSVMVVVLVIFMLIRREDLRNRVIRLSGEGSVTSMTKALDDAAHRISRFLLMQLVINGSFGVAVAAGLAIIGVPYPLVWGLLAGALRYLPYIGTWVGAALPLLVALLLMHGWAPVLEVLGLFVVLELLTANLVEPWLFGRSIGVSEVALLVAAAFWAWLWGPLGLVLAIPMTAVLAVLGRYVPQMEFFDILLGDEPVLPEHVRYYQRLLARDEDEAARLVEDYYKEHSGEQVLDQVFLPALLLTVLNRDRGKLNDDDQRFILQVTRELIDDLPSLPEEEQKINGNSAAESPALEMGEESMLLLGCPARDEADELLLHMLQRMLDPRKYRLEILTADTLAAEVLQRVEQDKPAAVCIASMPPRGLTHPRYLCKRLRSKFPQLKILVLIAGREGHDERAIAWLRAAGADQVATNLSECHKLLVPMVQVLALNDGQREQAASAAS
jgi:predicted PurR-regulated permease PerM